MYGFWDRLRVWQSGFAIAPRCGIPYPFGARGASAGAGLDARFTGGRLPCGSAYIIIGQVDDGETRRGNIAREYQDNIRGKGFANG